MTSYYIIPEQDSDDLDCEVNGIALAHAPEGVLDALCTQLGVPSLLSFFSVDAEEAEEYYPEVAAGKAEPPEEQWFSANEGLRTVRALLSRADALPLKDATGRIRYGETDDESGVEAELRWFEEILVRLEQKGIKWHLGIG